MTWNDEQKQDALYLFNCGHSAGDIGRRLGKSRNAVIGIIHRNRAAVSRTGQPSQGRVFAPDASKPSPRLKPPTGLRRDLKAPAPCLKDDGTRFGTMDLSDSVCRWPHGEVGSAEFHYCANKPELGSPYCEYHADRAIRPQPDKAA